MIIQTSACGNFVKIANTKLNQWNFSLQFPLLIMQDTFSKKYPKLSTGVSMDDPDHSTMQINFG